MTVEDKREIRDSQQCLTSKRPQVLRSVLVFRSECSMPFRVLFVFSLWERQEGTPKTQPLVRRTDSFEKTLMLGKIEGRMEIEMLAV